MTVLLILGVLGLVSIAAIVLYVPATTADPTARQIEAIDYHSRPRTTPITTDPREALIQSFAAMQKRN